MIRIEDKKDCCGCSACAQRCPKHCISMVEDEEGFLYPKVDVSICVNCRVCEKVCPVLNKGERHEPLAVYAAKNSNYAVRMASSSGGIFTILAERTIEHGGVVFGACWNDNWEVVHDYVETKDDIAKFRGSKYVQSCIGDCFKKAEEFLKSGREVLFSGTPCQIAGLTRYLRKEYDNLLKVECVCHSVPSPGVWRNYLSNYVKQNNRKKEDIKAIKFRDKITGWKGYSCSIAYVDGDICVEPREKNLWMKGFLAGLYNRPSCTQCPAKGHSCADVVLGDFWGIDELAPEIDDDKGICVVIVNTDKGQSQLNMVGVVKEKHLSLKLVAEKNPAILHSAKFNEEQSVFMEKMKNRNNPLPVIYEMTKEHWFERLWGKIHLIIHLIKSKVV